MIKNQNNSNQSVLDENAFFNNPILNSPYEIPTRHWELIDGQPTQRIVHSRRLADFVTPIPKARSQMKGVISVQDSLDFDNLSSLSTNNEQYTKDLINEVRAYVADWRNKPKSEWRVTPETGRLLDYWRNHKFEGIRPFFYQVEAVEIAIWLTEVAPQIPEGKKFIDHLDHINEEFNDVVPRLALKLATGAGKTTVMAMLIAWQTINAVKSPKRQKFTKGFLIIAPGITIRDRLRVLQPNDPDSYYQNRELVPIDLLPQLQEARVVITNYHAFMLREKIQISAGTRAALQGRKTEKLDTTESEGEMLQRVIPSLMGLERIMIINDEAHHCYREKKTDPSEDYLKGLTGSDKTDAKKDAAENQEAARVWMSGLKAIKKYWQAKNGKMLRVFDLSATPFFISGSGYAQGSMFPWTLSDFSLMDAIECGIVKLPRVPVDDSSPKANEDAISYRNLWEHIRKDMPKKTRGAQELDPRKLPPLLCSALDALYSHYKKVFDQWLDAGIKVPPCFIVVCNNTQTSKLIYDYISGGDGKYSHGQFPLFRNFDEFGEPLSRPRTILIDSAQLESGTILDDNFKKVASQEIEIFKRETLQRGGALANQLSKGKELDDASILREVMNTVGKKGRLGESVRCVVSVSMLAEGWDANTVTHVMGLRAFGTQLLCEQVVGRALRRQSYTVNDEGKFPVEYADVLGIPFDFTATPVVVSPKPPVDVVSVHAIRPDRDASEISFPRVCGYRKELKRDVLSASFTEDSSYTLKLEEVGPNITKMSAIVGQEEEISPKDLLENMRDNTIAMHLTSFLLTHITEAGEVAPLHLFGQLNAIVKEWLSKYLYCQLGTYKAQVLYRVIAEQVCERIKRAIYRSVEQSESPLKAIVDPYNPVGSTRSVNFTTSKKLRYETSEKCHVNWAILDSDWEGSFCKVLEQHPRVKAYVKNQGLGFTVPYRYKGEVRTYIPDFIVRVDDGHGENDLLNLVVEVKGFRGEDVKDKTDTMKVYWIPGVNALKDYGRWAFIELRNEETLIEDFENSILQHFNDQIDAITEI